MAADNARGWWHRAARLGDTGSGSGRHFWVAQGSPDVFINGRAALRAGDSYDAPGCVLAQGSATVFINGRAAGRFGDAISGGGRHICGSPTVLIGDRHPDAKADPGSDPQGMAFAEAGGCMAAWDAVRHEADTVDEISAGDSWPSLVLGQHGMTEIERNRLINRKYAGLYRDLPENRWAGMATVVSAQVGCSMQLMSVVAGGDRPGFLAAELDMCIRALGEGNVAIFKKLYPPLRMVARYGYDRFLNCVASGAINPPDALVEGIKALKNGSIDKAADIIIKYEQKVVAQPVYEKHKHAFAFMQDAAVAGRYLGRDFESIPLSTHCGGSEKIPFGGDITSADDRIDYFRRLNRAWNGILDWDYKK